MALKSDEPTAALAAAPATSTQIDAVFDALVADIVRGTYAPCSRLPAERELSRMLGASRPTLREALRRLDEWHLVSARRGSGIVVRERRDWMIEVLPVYLRHSQPGPDRPRLATMASEMLLMRRLVVVSVLRVLAGRVPAGGTAASRAHAARAWEMRAETPIFVKEDFEIFRALTEAANSLPSMWMLNRLSAVYVDIARNLSGVVTPPAEYLEVMSRMLDQIEAGDFEAAAGEVDRYFERHDQRLIGALAGLP